MILDTIIARASASGIALRGIVRISGPHAVATVKNIVDQPECLMQSHCRTALSARIVLPSGMPPFPAQLLVWPCGQSYTGDETVEIHTVGSPVLLDAIIAAVLQIDSGTRLAEPGEFTLRAFLSGRLDLTQAEAVLGIIDAANSDELHTALQQLAGNLSFPMTDVRTSLFEALSQLEASLDFADQWSDTPTGPLLQEVLANALEQVEMIRRKINDRAVDSERPKVVLTGLPNVGKSTLFNKLLQRDAAIVSPQAGTTRDYLEAEMNWQEIPVLLVDTAGIDASRFAEKHDAERPIQTAGDVNTFAQKQSQEMLQQADVIIYCYEHSCEIIPSVVLSRGEHHTGTIVFFQTKMPNESLEGLFAGVGEALRLSSVSGMLPSTALRCRSALDRAYESLCRAQDAPDDALIALELRHAINHLGLIDGSIHTEDILDNIFSRFCIGK